MEKTYVGIDISKDSLDVAVHGSEKQWQFTNNPAGISKVCTLLTDLSPALVVFEATGGATKSLCMLVSESLGCLQPRLIHGR